MCTLQCAKLHLHTVYDGSNWQFHLEETDRPRLTCSHTVAEVNPATADDAMTMDGLPREYTTQEFGHAYSMYATSISDCGGSCVMVLSVV
jgi:hypothetical protein